MAMTSQDVRQDAAGARFVHLHLHSEYSLLDGGNRMDALVSHVKALGMDAVAVTDHGTLAGAREFYNAARKAGIKPILGIEAYVAITKEGMPCSRTERGAHVATGGAHLVLLARTLEGWKNLVRLSSDSFVNGFYSRPRMDRETLAAHAGGLIAINGHLSSSIANHLGRFAQSKSKAAWDAAVEEARWHAEVFGADECGEPSFYIELQRHNEEQERINPLLVKLAKELSLPLICDNDAHFLRKEDYDTHDTLCCISMGRLKSDADRIKYPPELYVKSPDEMAKLFPEAPEAVLNTVRVAARCNVTLPEKESHAPVVRVRAPKALATFRGGDATEWFKSVCREVTLEAYELGSGDDQAVRRECDRALRMLAEAGAVWRFGVEGATGVRRERLDRELNVICGKHISPYFLIVWDFVNWARQQGIPAMARGSGVGTMVGYLLGLSNADPEEFGLLFERFTDPDRSEYPDIDIDFCQDGRGRVIDYVREKYGYVAQISTFAVLKARAAIKDVGRVLGFTPAETQRLADMVPDATERLADVLASGGALQAECEKDQRVRRLVQESIALEGHKRHQGIHAAGLIIATQPLENIVPLARPSDGAIGTVTQWDGPTCEKAGLLKMDLLGLRTLSTMELAKRLVRSSLPDVEIWRAVGRESESADPNAPHPLDLDRVPRNDPRVLEVFRRGQTQGIFQFESDGMKRTLQQIQPDRLEDLIAANALFRPGPMESIGAYAARKGRREPVPAVHPIFDAVVAETYGIMVYQEQVMQVLNRLGGIPLRHAYSIIKAISKKKESEIAAARADFVAGAGRHQVDAAKAEELFALIQRFAGYGFNKSHSAGYAILAYQTAYLKCYFPAAFMAAVLTYESQASKVEDWRVYLDECRTVAWATPNGVSARGTPGLRVAPPDVNASDEDFSVRFESGEPATSTTGHLRFGLRALKGAGASAIRALIDARGSTPFRDLVDFCERVDLASANRTAIEALIKGGAFDSLHGLESRAALMASLQDVMRGASRAARDRADGQLDMFGGFVEPNMSGEGAASATLAWLKKVRPWDMLESLANEREVLGIHVSGHPLERYQAQVQAFGTATSLTLRDMANDAAVVVAAIVTGVRELETRNGRMAGQRMAMLELSDTAGECRGVVFAAEYARYGALLQKDAMVMLSGQVDRSREPASLKVNFVAPIAEAAAHFATRVEIVLDGTSGTDGADAAQSLGMVRMAGGALRQLSNSVDATKGRPVEVHLLVPSGERRVRMVVNGARIVPTHEAISRLTKVCEGRARVIVMGGWVPPVAERRSFASRSNWGNGDE